MKSLNLYIKILVAGLFTSSLVSCGGHDDTGWEFAPNMYNSIAYHPMSEIEKNTVNPHGMTMREPVAGTVARRNYQTRFKTGDSTYTRDLMVYNLGPNDLAYAETLKNPIPWSQKTEDEGKVLYERNCQHCHGETGAGDGKVAAKYKGVPNYTSDAVKVLSEGHVFFVITNGIRRMWPHKAQVNPEERWKIVHYVHKLQQGGN